MGFREPSSGRPRGGRPRSDGDGAWFLGLFFCFVFLCVFFQWSPCSLVDGWIAHLLSPGEAGRYARVCVIFCGVRAAPVEVQKVPSGIGLESCRGCIYFWKSAVFPEPPCLVGGGLDSSRTVGRETCRRRCGSERAAGPRVRAPSSVGGAERAGGARRDPDPGPGPGPRASLGPAACGPRGPRLLGDSAGPGRAGVRTRRGNRAPWGRWELGKPLGGSAVLLSLFVRITRGLFFG